VYEGYFPTALPAGDTKFDLIVFNDVLEHVADPWSMLDDVRDHLTPDGRVLAAIPSVVYGLWDIFVVIPAYRFAKKFLWMPVLGPKPAFFSYHFIKFYHRRFKSIALARRAAGEAGARNNGRRIKAYFNLNLSPMHMVLRGMKLWMFAEADNVRLQLRRLFRRSGAAAPAEGVEARG
jgi:SAM-dependent methyltransferase